MSNNTPNLESTLCKLHLTHYIAGFHRYGCYQMNDLTTITEEDMAKLGLKLGHRRALQREIASFHNHPFNKPLSSRDLESFDVPCSREGGDFMMELSISQNGEESIIPARLAPDISTFTILSSPMVTKCDEMPSFSPILCATAFNFDRKP